MPILQERIKKFYSAIQLPQDLVEDDRGFFKCCDPVLVLGDSGGDSWKNDVNSAWIKLSAPTDTATFLLLKDDEIFAPYVFTVNPFPNEPNAFFATVFWDDVLALGGPGCYSIVVKYNISGIIGEFTWGIYNLKPYSITNALGTARVRVKLNLIQEIESINFKGANVEDSLRFRGFIGDRQPNTEIDNLIYQNRAVKTVVRENLESYIITTDPLSDEFIKKFTQLYLLSENELFIADYNAHNADYFINDVPTVVEETPEIDYLDRFQRRAILTCTVGDRKKNKRTYY